SQTALDRALTILNQEPRPAEIVQVDALRIIELALIAARAEGAAPISEASREKLAAWLLQRTAEAGASATSPVERENLRILAYLNRPEVVDRLLAVLESSSASRDAQIHAAQ